MTWLPRLTVRRVVIGLALVAFVVAAVGVISALRTFDPEPHRAVLDELQIPDAWELAHEEIVQNIPPIAAASRVTRYYLVDADPTEVVVPAERMFVEANFTIEVQRAPRNWCDTPETAVPVICPEKVMEPCSTNGPTGPTTCYFYASRGQECVTFRALDRGEMQTYYRGMDDFHISDPVRIVVVVSDHYAGPLPCDFPTAFMSGDGDGFLDRAVVGGLV